MFPITYYFIKTLLISPYFSNTCKEETAKSLISKDRIRGEEARQQKADENVRRFRNLEPLLSQLRVHRNLRVEHLRDRASRLRILCRRVKRVCARPRNFRNHIQMHRRDRPSRFELFHSQRRRGVNALR